MVHLSVVATSRNDNHGKNLLYRMQHFLNGFIEQCTRHSLSAEIIFVEWNPPKEFPSLKEALSIPKEKGPCKVRFIHVPHEIHQTLDHSNKIPLFQMIGKNVGIRRALGKFVLATNIDILFPDELICFMRDRLKKGVLYRVDRRDVSEVLPNTSSLEILLEHCAKNFFRVHGKFGTDTGVSFRRIAKKLCKSFLYKMYPAILSNAHTNACGDFTLLSSEDWAELRGYPEWNIFSWHIDSLFLFQAKQNGIKECDLPKKMSIYHIEHQMGYTPEKGESLFERLKRNNVPYLTNAGLKEHLYKMKKKKKVLYNDENWGMANTFFEER